MNFETWKPLYKQIIADFNFSEQKDKEAAIFLNDLLKNHQQYLTFPELKPYIQKRNVVVVGASSHVQDQITNHMDLINKSVCISADGATSAVMDQNIIPDIIVTDFDGNIQDQLRANTQGSILVVHAHGDNKEIMKDTIPKIKWKITGTIQTDPSGLEFVFNVGGFTDGDRAVFLASHFHAAQIKLIGFDFHGPIGRYSNPQNKDISQKRKKLLWAERLIALLSKDHQITSIDGSDDHG